MKRLALAALLLASIGLPASPASAGTTCKEPVTTHEYTPEAMTYRLTIDLHGCDWWDGSALTMVAFLTRDDGETEDFGFSLQACSGVVGNDEDPYARPDKVGCEIFVTLEHPPVEAAHYRADASYLWHDGPRDAHFESTCVSSVVTAACRNDYAPAARAPGVHT